MCIRDRCSFVGVKSLHATAGKSSAKGLAVPPASIYVFRRLRNTLRAITNREPEAGQSWRTPVRT
eukprot:4848857-Alexandrium_andersonii.AAC.1